MILLQRCCRSQRSLSTAALRSRPSPAATPATSDKNLGINSRNPDLTTRRATADHANHRAIDDRSFVRSPPHRPTTTPISDAKHLLKYRAQDSFSRQHELSMELAPNRLMTRDFIHDSLYNREYGYFSRRAIIFSYPEPMNFNEISCLEEFDAEVSKWYQEYDEAEDDSAAQVWHTPTELFKPFYGYALAEYILREHHRRQNRANSPKPLIIYEMGAGNGTLMCNIIEYIRRRDPEAFAQLQYNVIEISQQLTERQEWQKMSRLMDEARKNQHVRIVNQSIFDWDTVVEEECFFVALEVIDNFAHDAVRYNLSTTDTPTYGQPLQTRVVFDDELQEYIEEYEPIDDPLIQRYLRRRQRLGTQFQSLVERAVHEGWRLRLRQRLPFAPNVSAPEFLPTMQMLFLEKLCRYFPRHHLLLSDFDTLPTEVDGLDAPVVQTRQRYRMIPCSTYLVTKGWFDIFFPTNFELMLEMYRQIRQEARHAGADDLASGRIETHSQFMLDHAQLDQCRLKSGELPIVDHYKNVKFLLS